MSTNKPLLPGKTRTPRTDKEAYIVSLGDDGVTSRPPDDHEVVDADFARGLELENAEAIKASGVLALLSELAGYAEVFAGDIGARGPSHREATVGMLRVRHVIAAENCLSALRKTLDKGGIVR